MPSTAVAAVQRPSSWCLIPSHLNLHHHAHHKRNLTALSLASEDSKNPMGNFCALTLPKPHSCSKGQENYYSLGYKSNSSQNHYHHLFLQFSPSVDTKGSNNRNSETRNQKKQVDEEKGFKNKKETRLLFSNMWWADVKAALGQRINLEAIFSTFVVVKDPKLALPNISVPDMRFIDWSELRRKGFRGVVFDKDNTITAPYSLTPWPPLGSSLERCKLEFGPDNIAVFSNSAGLHEYDHDGFKARALEEAIGLKVIRHRVKKPAGTAEEVEKHFGCDSSQLIMVGDRPFTDIVYGNRHGFLTILTDPLSLVEEPFIVGQVRKLETSFVNHWRRRGLKPSGHKLLPDPMVCVREPPAR